MALTVAQQAVLDAVEVVTEQQDIGAEKVVRIPVQDKNGNAGWLCKRLAGDADDAAVKAAMVELVSKSVQVLDANEDGLKSKAIADVVAAKLPTATAITNVTSAVDKVVVADLAAVVEPVEEPLAVK